MNRKQSLYLWSILLALFGLTLALTSADDGAMFRRNVSRTPEGETEEAAISMMPFYVPAQNAAGELVTIEYYDGADEPAMVDERTYAKPLISIYIDGIDLENGGTAVAPSTIYGMPGITSGVSFGHRDAFAALSLDDGTTWKNYNLSRTADLSSFTLGSGVDYPGDSVYMTFGVAGNRVLAAWLSKYCDGGEPAYTLTDEEKIALADFLGLDEDALYLQDIFGISGTQKSVDYSSDFPEVGEVPYSCVWTARGTLEYVANDDGTMKYDMVWRKAERMTSGRRDANRIEIGAAPGAGFVMVWQEDPEGLRPGQGLGPGEGWSGAIVNGQTDIWYSYIDWDDFDLVQDPAADLPAPIPLADFMTLEDTTQPKIGVPMAMPTRLTDNGKCQKRGDGDYTSAYCDPDGIDLDPELANGYELPPLDLNGDGISDVCDETQMWTNPGGTTQEICQTQDGRVLWGRVGSSRPRINLRGYDTDADGVNDSAWVVMAYEESKALGDEIDPITEDPIDIGKNVWYHTFDMFHPEMVNQGMQINPPAVDRETGLFYDLVEDYWENEFYETEIARRFNLMTQDYTAAGDEGLVGVLIYKQGIINQGGPADIFLRRLVLPDVFDPAVDNPFDYSNMVCDSWAYDDGSNPRYVRGLCLDPGINVSGSTIVSCSDGTTGDACADTFPWDGGGDDSSGFNKVEQWVQTPDNLVDESWANPFDVAKGHRGFLDGDIVMMMYAWSPNWKANSVGNDKYNLYIRRSFDGGATWTTTPADLGGLGTTTCENYLNADEPVCTPYAAGEFEQGRNVSQLSSTRITVLDPRYTPTTSPITQMMDAGELVAVSADELPYWDDETRDHSRFYIVYETGDNTTVAEGEATPLDLFYSRATVYGDSYFEVEVTNSNTGETELRWDWLENKREDLSGEAGVTANAAGTYFYAVWNQWREDADEVIHDSDMWFRRVWFNEESDSLPIAAITFASHTVATYDAGDLTFTGVAKDNDQLGDGIVAYEWTSSVDGLLSTEASFTIPVTELSDAIHIITFRAMDGEGNWSRGVSITVSIGELPYKIFNPMICQP